jgi:hypothetical protein
MHRTGLLLGVYKTGLRANRRAYIRPAAPRAKPAPRLGTLGHAVGRAVEVYRGAGAQNPGTMKKVPEYVGKVRTVHNDTKTRVDQWSKRD